MKWWSSTSNNNNNTWPRNIWSSFPQKNETHSTVWQKGATRLVATAVDDQWNVPSGGTRGSSCVVKEWRQSSGDDPGRRDRKSICWSDTRQPTAASTSPPVCWMYNYQCLECLQWAEAHPAAAEDPTDDEGQTAEGPHQDTHHVHWKTRQNHAVTS